MTTKIHENEESLAQGGLAGMVSDDRLTDELFEIQDNGIVLVIPVHSPVPSVSSGGRP